MFLMNEQEAKKIAESDLNQKGVHTFKLESIVNLAEGYWKLIYICKSSEKSKDHFYSYLIDDKTGHIENHMNSKMP